ncbi:MAG TPA: Na+/H+ antiporter NhaA [Pseudomonadales bacterium]|nr:Na+/H+ antiporter NhaA [Pseudomonadales bacterium]
MSTAEEEDEGVVPALKGGRPIDAAQEFLALESASGILLMVATALALLCANTALQPWYDALLETPVVVQVGALAIDKALLLWVNDGLMAVFFLLVGLEVKRELIEGELSDPKQMVLPGFGALGGVLVPAACFAALNWGDASAMQGWAIPTATDIAFALGVLALLGDRVPASLKVFLLVLAILDDLSAIIIIAVFYTADLSLTSLVLAAGAIVVLAVMNLRGVTRPACYVVVGAFLWVCVLKSGVHATLAGVALALAIPLRRNEETGESLLRNMEHGLHPWVAYGILPVFAFANAGLNLGGMSVGDIMAPVPLGIFVGLFLGKQVGVFAFAALAIALGLARRPHGASWAQLWGLSVLTGIGFTMSLFISGLAFQHAANAGGGTDLAADRLGILVGSLASALVGAGILWLAGGRTSSESDT